MNNEFLNGDFIAICVEATGESEETTRFTEIGAVKIRNLETADKFHTFIQDENKAFTEFIKFCGDTHIVISHNAPFDALFLKMGVERYGLEYKFTEIDTLELCRAALFNNRSRYDKMVEYYNFNIFNGQSALDSAQNAAELFIKFVSEIKAEIIEVMNNPHITYRRANPGDTERLCFIENSVFQENISPQYFLDRLNNPEFETEFLLAEYNGTVVGFAGLSFSFSLDESESEEKIGFLQPLAVLPEYRWDGTFKAG